MNNLHGLLLSGAETSRMRLPNLHQTLLNTAAPPTGHHAPTLHATAASTLLTLSTACTVSLRMPALTSVRGYCNLGSIQGCSSLHVFILRRWRRLAWRSLDVKCAHSSLANTFAIRHPAVHVTMRQNKLVGQSKLCKGSSWSVHITTQDWTRLQQRFRSHMWTDFSKQHLYAHALHWSIQSIHLLKFSLCVR